MSVLDVVLLCIALAPVVAASSYAVYRWYDDLMHPERRDE